MSPNNEVPINKNGPGKGKVNRQALIRQVIEQETNNGQPLDMKRVLLIATKRLEQAPEEVKKGIQLTGKEYRETLYSLNRRERQKSPTAVHEPPTNNKSHSTPSEFFTAQSILAAKEFLDHHCGGSLVKAQALLQLIVTLFSK